MRTLLPAIKRWRGEAKQIAVATLVEIHGSAPQPLGARMAVSSTGEMVGSVSGGCVEGAVVQEALGVMATHSPRLVEYGIADELAQSVGLACGGQIGVYIEPWLPNDAVSDTYEAAILDGNMIALATVVRGRYTGRRMLVQSHRAEHGTLGDPDIDRIVIDRAKELMAMQRSELALITLQHEPGAVFIDVQPPPPKLIIVGAVHIAIPLITFAKELGFHTTVLDARSAFATPARFHQVDRLQIGWPADILPDLGIDEATYFVVLTHDEKIDDPALVLACRSPARYIGALGSKRTHARRVERLRTQGLSDTEIARIQAPIGLDIGARRPEEIAVSIVAQLVAARNGL
jgi:xanthine dehydrogenase accessory factor